MAPSAKHFILNLLATLRRGSMPVAALVSGAGLFGIAGNSVRVALTRLGAAGLVVRDARGRYRLGPAALPVARRTTHWREIEGRLENWEGSWAAAATYVEKGAAVAAGFFWVAVDATFATVDAFALAAFDAAGALEVV